jgi:quercetin dioxygenase-like cupin family protein
MQRALLTILVAAVAAGGMALGHRDEHKGGENVKALSTVAIAEKLNGKMTKATTVEVTLKPGQASAPHRHPGPAFGYVLEGEYEWAIDKNPVKKLKVGDTFYEPGGCLHRVSRNPSKTARARVLAVVLHPADVKDIVIPEKKKE